MSIQTIPAIDPEIDLTPISLMPVDEKPNAKLAYAVLDQIDLQPERWNQGKWIGRDDCGTVGCFAGWACMLVGDEPDWLTSNESTGAEAVMTPEGSHLVDLRAAELLSIPRVCAKRLFYGGNDRETLGFLVNVIFGPRPSA